MRKIIVFNLITLDGYFAGEDGSIDWHHVDDEFNEFAVEQTATFDTIIFGRKTYEMFADFWPKTLRDPKTSPEDQKVAQYIEDAEKIVFSKILTAVDWKNTKLFHSINAAEVKKWKERKGGDMFILGSGTIVQAFANLGLIDEYRLLVNPLILGKGRPMFSHVKGKMDLHLTGTRTFRNGNVLLTYQVKQNG